MTTIKSAALVQYSRLFAALLAVFLLSVQNTAAMELNGLFRDGMVLQREMSVPVFGKGTPGKEITVELAGQKQLVKAGADGKFRAFLEPLAAGGPYELKVTGGKDTVVVKNVLIGEVWLASGQSNMNMPVKECLNAKEEIAEADFPQIRFFTVNLGKTAEPSDTLTTLGEKEDSLLNNWASCSPMTAGDFSAVAYFFARGLHRRLNVPVGIIASSWGGTVAEAWTPLKALESHPRLKSILTEWPKYNQDEKWLIEEYEKYEVELKVSHELHKPEPVYFNQPSVLYNANISPLKPYGIRGVIWYQGEENVFRAYQYRDVFPAMIRSWRESWEREFPFLFVQLANLQSDEISWAELREAQLMTLSSVPNTGMVVTIDIGDAGNVHPKNKQDVGYRLSLVARALVYGETGLEWSGPIYRSMEVQGNLIRIDFDHVGDGLVSRDGKPVAGFTIAGEDRSFFPAQARIENRQVVVWSDEVKKPVAVRYGWENNPEKADLYNQLEKNRWLPASPFRTDDWPGLTFMRKWD